MTAQAEIEKKEESLSVLMGKILEVPLKPLGESVNALSGDLERTNGRISEIFEALEASTEATERVKKSLLKEFQGLWEEDFWALGTKLEEQLKSLGESVSALSGDLERSVLGQFELKQSIADLYQQLNTTSSEVKVVMADSLHIGQAVLKELEGSRAALAQDLSQKNESLIKKATLTQNKLRSLTITTSTFFASMLIYVGYDLWSKFN